MAQTNSIKAIRAVLEDIAAIRLVGEIRFLPVFDDERHVYQINAVGWDRGKPVAYIVVLLEVKNNQVWILEDTTDYGVADALIENGVLETDIVLGWQNPVFMQPNQIQPNIG